MVVRSTPKPRAKKPATPKLAPKSTMEPVRSARRGDTSGAKTSAGVARHVVQAKLSAAQISQQSALRDILASSASKAEALKYIRSLKSAKQAR